VLVPWFLFAGSLLAYWVTVRYSIASHGRAMQLADELGLSRLFVEKCLERHHRKDASAEEMEAVPLGQEE